MVAVNSVDLIFDHRLRDHRLFELEFIFGVEGPHKMHSLTLVAISKYSLNHVLVLSVLTQPFLSNFGLSFFLSRVFGVIPQPDLKFGVVVFVNLLQGFFKFIVFKAHNFICSISLCL